MQFLATRPMHSRQLFLLLLLHRSKQRLHIRIVLRLLLSLLRCRLWFRLRLRSVFLLRPVAGTLLLLHGLFAAESDLEIAFRRDVRRMQTQRLAVIADGVVEGIR